jgi:hypothetical protein
MTYGFQAINESDFLQIDDDSTSFSVIATGTATGRVTIPNNFPEDIFVVVRPTNPNTQYAWKLRGFMSDYTPDQGPNIGVRFRRAYMYCNDSRYLYQNQPCDYAIIERVDSSGFTAPTSGYGLNVYRANGDIGYSSEFPTYRVKSTRNYYISASNSGHGIWHTPIGNDQVLGMYAYLASYSEYRSRTYSIGGIERGHNDYDRLALFDYPNNQFGTHIQSYYSDSQNGASTYDYVYEVLRTEMVGYVT